MVNAISTKSTQAGSYTKTSLGILEVKIMVFVISSLENIKARKYQCSIWPRGYINFFMLNSIERDISSAHKR